MGKQLRWGIAGVGMIAHDFLTAMASLSSEQHKVIAIAGKDLDRAQRLATLHNIGTAYEGYESIATDNDIGMCKDTILYYVFTINLYTFSFFLVIPSIVVVMDTKIQIRLVHFFLLL